MMRPVSKGSLGADAVVGILEDSNMGTHIERHKPDPSLVLESNQEAEIVKPLNARVALRYQCMAWVELLEVSASCVSECRDTAVNPLVWGDF